MGLTQRLGTIPLAIQTDSSNNVGIGGAANASYKLAVTGAGLFSSSILANSVMSLGDDGTYGATYKTLGLTGNTNGTHRILAGTSDDMYIAAATGRGVKLCVNGSITSILNIASTGAATFSSSVTASSGIYNPIDNASDTIRIYRGNTAPYLNESAIFDVAGGMTNIRNKSLDTVRSIIFSFSTDGSTSYTERMRITNGGNVGIGLTNPTALLQVSGGDRETGIRIESSNNASYSMKCTSTGGHEYQLFARSGNTGKLSIYDQTTGAYVWEINSSGLMYSLQSYVQTNGNSANVYVANDGAFVRSVASSQRFKENIIDWDGNGLSTILALKPKTFTYKDDYYSHPDREFLGLIAEEVAEVSSYLADFENEDGTGQVENVRYANIVVPLIKAIQEQQALITELSAKVTALENK